MRGLTKLITGLFTISALVLVAGSVVEPIVSVVASDSAVQSYGWDSTAGGLQQVLLQWMPLLFVGFLVVFGVMWAIRRGRTTEVRRR